MSKKTEITYRQVNEYFIPNFILPPEEANIRLGKWGMMHKDYLLNNKKVFFTILLTEGKLWQYLADIDNKAQQMFDTIVEQMKNAEGVTEQLKEENQMEWIQKSNNIQVRVSEIINHNIIYR